MVQVPERCGNISSGQRTAQMPAQNGVVRFGSFEADLCAGELRRNGIRLKLQSQPFRVLALLLQRPGQVLTREELQQELWPSGTFVDYEQGLATAVNKARDALGDSSANPRFIETVPRCGYRFIAPVTTVLRESPSLALAARPPGGSRHIWIYGIAAAAALASLVLVGWLLHKPHQQFAIDQRDRPVVLAPQGEYRSRDSRQAGLVGLDLDRGHRDETGEPLGMLGK